MSKGLINKHENSEGAFVVICGAQCVISRDSAAGDITVDPRNEHQCPHCVPPPLLGTHRQKATGKRKKNQKTCVINNLVITKRNNLIHFEDAKCPLLHDFATYLHYYNVTNISGP